VKDNEEFCRIVNELIDQWCERRELKALSILLPAWPLGMGLTDDWERVRHALRHARAMVGSALPESERQQINQLIAALDEILY
jgi:hypothetical protein